MYDLANQRQCVLNICNVTRLIIVMILGLQATMISESNWKSFDFIWINRTSIIHETIYPQVACIAWLVSPDQSCSLEWWACWSWPNLAVNPISWVTCLIISRSQRLDDLKCKFSGTCSLILPRIATNFCKIDGRLSAERVTEQLPVVFSSIKHCSSAMKFFNPITSGILINLTGFHK